MNVVVVEIRLIVDNVLNLFGLYYLN